MSTRSEERAAEQQWRESQRAVLHDEHDTATDPDPLAPLIPVTGWLAVILVAGCTLAGLVLHAIVSTAPQ